MSPASSNSVSRPFGMTFENDIQSASAPPRQNSLLLAMTAMTPAALWTVLSFSTQAPLPPPSTSDCASDPVWTPVPSSPPMTQRREPSSV